MTNSHSIGLVLSYSSILDKYENEENLSIKQISSMLQNSKNIMNLDQDSFVYLKAIKQLENEEANISKTLNEMQRAELMRINNEFLFNDYERRFKVTQEEVVSALIGEDYTPFEYNKLIREQKVGKFD
jgi:hypothetical protein